MPPRLPRVAIVPSAITQSSIAPSFRRICPICSASRALRPAFSRARCETRSQYRLSSRQQSNVANASVSSGGTPIRLKNPRLELRDALADLQKQAGNYVNISRLQLALRGLDQPPGQETIRIAVLGLGEHGTKPLSRAKNLLRLLLADPLAAEEEWEQILTKDDLEGKPLLLKVGHNGTEGLSQSNTLVQEMNVSSPMLNGHKLEILALDIDIPLGKALSDEEWTNLLLIPTMRTPTSSTGRHTLVTTPVHKSLVIGEGISGAAIIQQYPLELEPGLTKTSVNFRSIHLDETLSSRYQVAYIDQGAAALKSFRQSVHNATAYEQDWFASGIPELLAWLKDGTSPTSESMKAPLQGLIQALLKDTSREIHLEESRRLSASLSAKLSPSKVDNLKRGLTEWAERAHTELRDSLGIAFKGRRWRKLGWWKLFWRVDDVSMIATDILNQRFLTDAEKELIYLAGVIDEALSKDAPITFEKDWPYKPVVEQEARGILTHAPPPKLDDLIETKDDSQSTIKPQPWPLEIHITRALLASDTIPALQALAQKLVLQTITSSTFSTAFAGLIYVSTLSTSLYEAGAVAALGTVWSLRRMQGKWETARTFWEGEVREEGRKAVRGVESVIANALVQPDRPLEGAEELNEAKMALKKAEAALVACQ